MKKGLHPEWKETTVKCNSCGTTFKTHSTVSEITVEICSHCHPFYTGKQKLVDTAGRVDRFRAHQAAAKPKAEAGKKQSDKPKQPAKAEPGNTEKLAEIKKELEKETVSIDTKQ